LTTGSQSRIQTLWQRLQPLPQIRFFELLLDAFIADAPVEKCQIGGGGGVEELEILRKHADRAAQIFQSHSAKLLSIEVDASRSRIVQAEEQAGNRRFAAAGASEQSQHFARLKLERDVLQDVLLSIIAESDGAECDRQRVARQRGVSLVLKTRLNMKKLLDAFDAGGCLLQIFDLLLNGLQRRGKHNDGVHKQAGSANSELMLDVQVWAQGQPGCVADDIQEVGAEEGQIA